MENTCAAGVCESEKRASREQAVLIAAYRLRERAELEAVRPLLALPSA